MTKLMFLNAAVVCLLGGLTLSLSTAPAKSGETAAAKKQFLNLDYRAKPKGYTHVVSSAPGRMIFLSGAGGYDRKGRLPADFAGQAENTFKNLENGLKLAGATFKDVVKINYYLTDMDDLTELRRVRANYLNMAAPPAATAVETRLHGAISLEVELVAVVHE